MISRRTFVKDGAALAAATGLPLWFVEREIGASEPAQAVTSPNDRPGVALVGCGGMGRGDANSARRFGDIVAVCDADENRAFANALALAERADSCRSRIGHRIQIVHAHGLGRAGHNRPGILRGRTRREKCHQDRNNGQSSGQHTCGSYT